MRPNEILKYEYSAEVMEICESLRKSIFKHLAPAKIIYTFRTTFRKDSEGNVVIGEARKLQTRERDIYKYDFQISMHKDSWKTASSKEKERLCWHELNHLIVKRHFNGEPKTDKAGRIQIALKKHDIVLKTFLEEIKRYGPTIDEYRTLQTIIENFSKDGIVKPQKKKKRLKIKRR